MIVIQEDNVNGAFRSAMNLARHDDRWRAISPRGNQTMEFFEPVATVYQRPWRRVLFCATRDANPFFHLMEALWMLSGGKDAEWISQFSSNIAQFAEDDGYFHGAYGHRWRYYFSFDQLHNLIEMMKKDPDTRRAVLAMWDAHGDLRNVVAWPKKDIPCNTHVYFKIRDGKLQMLVSCRSNDIIWGCYGANAVHFSVLQEYMASAIGVGIGPYTHVSDSWHYYTDNPTWKKIRLGAVFGQEDYYAGHGYTPSRIDTTAIVSVPKIEVWNQDLYQFMGPSWYEDQLLYNDFFFQSVAVPMRDAWRIYKRGDVESAVHRAKSIQASDWRLACMSWLMRRRPQRQEERAS